MTISTERRNGFSTRNNLRLSDSLHGDSVESVEKVESLREVEAVESIESVVEVESVDEVKEEGMEENRSAPELREISFSDLTHSLSLGFRDFLRAPGFGLFFGGFFAAGGLLLVYSVFVLDLLWLTYPLVIGFALIGPFAATGLYEVSRKLESGQRPEWSGVLGVMWLQRRREFGWMAFVTLFVFWIWMYQVRTLVTIFFGSSGFASFEGFLNELFTTWNGWFFLLAGHLAGAVISLSLYSVTVISCPLLLDRDVDFVTAMIASIRAVLKSPFVMIGWGIFVVVCILLSALPAFLGLLITLPVLGHATWHLYRRAVVR